MAEVLSEVNRIRAVQGAGLESTTGYMAAEEAKSVGPLRRADPKSKRKSIKSPYARGKC